MSLLSPRVKIALTPGRVAVADGRSYHDANVASPGWSGALESLAELLSTSGLRGRASVTLSHHLAPIHLLPAPPVVLKVAEMQGWIADYLVRHLGESARELRVAWQAELPGNPFLVSVLEQNALAELEAVIRSASLEPVKVQPWLAGAWNRARRKFSRGRGWFVLAEPERLTLAGVERGRIQCLRSALMQEDAVRVLANLLKREAMLAGETSPAPVWIESAMSPLNWQQALGARSVHVLASGNGALSSLLVS